jgi:hypothetical protein
MKLAQGLVVAVCLLAVGCSDKETRKEIAALKSENAALRSYVAKLSASADTVGKAVATLKKQMGEEGEQPEGALRAMAACLAKSRRVGSGFRYTPSMDVRRCGALGLK